MSKKRPVAHGMTGFAVACGFTVLAYAVLNTVVWCTMINPLFSLRIGYADMRTAVVVARETQPDWPLEWKVEPRSRKEDVDPEWSKLLGDPVGVVTESTTDTGTLGRSDLGPDLTDALAPAIGDTARLFLFRSNPGGATSDPKSAIPAPDSVCLVLQLKNATDDAKNIAPRRFALCIETSGGLFCGGGVEARMFEVAETGCLLESDRGPFQVLRTKGVVLRPSAALASEEEVTERFLEYVDRILRTAPSGAAAARLNQGTRSQIARALTSLIMAQLGVAYRPTEAEVAEYNAIAQLWGHPALAAPLVRYESLVKRSMLVWARRFNGSDWWGVIQVMTLFVCVWVVFDCVARWAKWAPTAPAVAWETEYAMAGYGLWLMPTAGFAGTVAGLILAVGESGRVLADNQIERRAAVQEIANSLATAFDTTFVALLCTAVAYCVYSYSKAEREQSVVESTDVKEVS